MKIVIAPDSFKESLAAAEVAAAIACGLRAVLPEATCVLVPIADGGEGTIATLVGAMHGVLVEHTVQGPLGDAVVARYARLGGAATAIIEMAEASGLTRVAPAARDAARASSFGTGELIRHAIDHGARRVIVCLGGSATNDGGAGMLQALGVRLLDARGRVIVQPLGGRDLAAVCDIDAAAFLTTSAAIQFEAACDVDNPLCGPRGATATFGAQKGADGDTLRVLDQNLKKFFELIERKMQKQVMSTPGAGAAGGMGAALMALCDARLRPGIELVLEAIDFARHLDGADVVITGEGRLDAQTAAGKAPAGVARAAHARGIPVIALGGGLADDAEALLAATFDALEAAVTHPQTLAEALRYSAENLERAGRRIGLWLRLVGQLERRSAELRRRSRE